MALHAPLAGAEASPIEVLTRSSRTLARLNVIVTESDATAIVPGSVPSTVPPQARIIARAVVEAQARARDMVSPLLLSRDSSMDSSHTCEHLLEAGGATQLGVSDGH